MAIPEIQSGHVASTFDFIVWMKTHGRFWMILGMADSSPWKITHRNIHRNRWFTVVYLLKMVDLAMAIYGILSILSNGPYGSIWDLVKILDMF
jgi:nitrate reductase NapE component